MSDYTQGNSFYESDSFESETECQKNHQPRKHITPQPSSNKNNQIYKDYKSASITAKHRQRNNNKKIMAHKRSNTNDLDFTAQRILSARKHKITDQNNIIQELQMKIDDLQMENKTLKSQAYRQEKALTKIDGKQSDLPRILEQHQSEMSSLREQLRRTKEVLNNELKLRKDNDNEILKLRNSLSKANQLVAEKNLGERSTLQIQLMEFQEKFDISERSLESTNKHLEHLEKSHKRELYNLKKQIKQYENQCLDMGKEMENLRSNIKEKEKLLEIQNIYSHRIKIPHRLPVSANDQILDKLHFNNLNGKENNTNKVNNQANLKDDSYNLKYLDPEKIKDDIRKILEEEILSGRIKPFELQGTDNHGYLPESVSPAQDSYNTGRLIGSDIFEIDPQTQIQTISTEITIPKEEIPKIDEEHKEKQIILNKLKSIDKQAVDRELKEKSELKYSYPKDGNYIEEDESINEIETISAVNNSDFKPPKLYKFNGAVENLHQGIPVNGNTRRASDIRKSSIISKTESIRSHIDKVSIQENNNNVDESRDEILPPLSEFERQNKERYLMSELFGANETNGLFKSRTINLPWENNDIVRKSSISSPSNVRTIDLSRSEELEEILL